MNSIVLDDVTSAFIGADQKVGIVVHEEDGEILRLEGDDITFGELAMLRFIQTNEPVPIQQIRDEYDADAEKVDEVVDKLHHRGEIYQPQKGEFRIVSY